MTDEATPRPAAKGSEWFWRFLATAMIVVIGWVVWIAYQLNAPPLVTSAAFEAAAKARASRNTEGRIAPAAGAGAESSTVHAAAAKQPPVNLEKLKLSDTLSAAAPAGARPATGAPK